jgi:signal peptidase
MTPSINVYDVVVDYKVDNASDIKVGDVITFRSTSAISKDLIVTHRVIDIKIVNGEIQYVTKGDYNATADSDTAKFENVIGRVILRFPQLGRVQFFLASKMGWFIVVLLPAACVIIYDFIKLFKLIMLKKDADKIIGKDNNVVIESEVIAKEQSKEKKQEVQKAQVNNIDIKKIKEKLINNFNKIKIKLKELFSRCIKRKKKCDKEEEIINDALEKIKNTDYTESLSDLKKYNDKK